MVDIIVQETIANAPAAGDVPVELVRTFVLEDLAEAYPPGGFSGYLQFVADEGFSIGSRGSDTSNTPIQGGLAWGLLGIEALAAGVAAAATARRSHTWSGPAVSTVTDTTAGLPDSSDQ